MIKDIKEFVKATWRGFALLLIVFAIAGFGIGIRIEYTLGERRYTVSTIYVVQEGDTLIDICWTYQNMDCRHPYIFEYMDEIKELNPFLEKRKSQLQVGDKILIRYMERD